VLIHAGGCGCRGVAWRRRYRRGGPVWRSWRTAVAAVAAWLTRHAAILGGTSIRLAGWHRGVTCGDYGIGEKFVTSKSWRRPPIERRTVLFTIGAPIFRTGVAWLTVASRAT